jgi:flagellar protein FlaG
MDVDITRMTGRPASPKQKGEHRQQESAPLHSQTAEFAAQEQKKSAATMAVKQAEIDQYLREVFRDNPAFNKKLKFIVNGELNQVVVKVIDGNTDKVIREIPPEALQKLRVHMQRSIGLIFDEFI